MKDSRGSTAISIVALVTSIAALCLGGAVAAEDLINSGDIPPNTIKSSDLAKNAVRSPDLKASAVQGSDIRAGAVTSSDIGEGEVQPSDITLPAPQEMRDTETAVVNPADTAFVFLGTLGAYDKKDGSSVLQVEWNGTVEGRNGGDFTGCVFQLRVDGQSSAGGGGEVFGSGLTSVSTSALFPGLGAGPHAIEVWARLGRNPSGLGPQYDKCGLSPDNTGGVPQSIVVSEQIV